MLHPLRALKRSTGLWIARAVVTELRGIRVELANVHTELQAVRHDQLRQSHVPVQVNVGQGFVTAKPAADPIKDEAWTTAETGSVTYTDDARLAEYAFVATYLQENLKRAPTTEEIEREFLLQMGSAG